MKKLVLPLFLLFISTHLFAQKSSDLTIKESCDCIKNNEHASEVMPAAICFAEKVKKNQNALIKEFKIKTKDEKQAIQEIMANLKPLITKNCPEFVSSVMRSMSENITSSSKADIKIDSLKLDHSACLLFHSGKLKCVKAYMNNALMPISDPTSYSEIKGDFYYDYEGNGKYVTKWALKWLNDCEYEETLIESNSPNIKSIFKNGDKVTSRAIGSTKDKMLYMYTKMMGMEFIYLLQKI